MPTVTDCNVLSTLVCTPLRSSCDISCSARFVSGFVSGSGSGLESDFRLIDGRDALRLNYTIGFSTHHLNG